MKNVLYFPYMNLPSNCPALSSALLFSEQVNIIAPLMAKINDPRTNDYLRSGLIKRLDPGQSLRLSNYSTVVNHLANFLKNYPPSMRINETLHHRSDNFSIHYGKMIYSESSTTKDKLDTSQNYSTFQSSKMIELLQEHNIVLDQEEYLLMPKEVGLYILGLLAKEIVATKKLDMICSSTHLEASYDTIKNESLKKLIIQTQLKLMPTLVIDKLTTAEIIKLKSDLGDEIQKYVLSLKRDLDLVINGIFEHTKVELDEKRTKIEIQNECNRLVSKYHSDLLRFERHANSSKKYNIERAFFSVIFPTALGIIIGGDIGTILAGFSRVGSLGIPDLKITPSQLARQKVIYDISKRF